jgi:lipoprotein-anchoring transpeptidase ErfK/SrfK
MPRVQPSALVATFIAAGVFSFPAHASSRGLFGSFSEVGAPAPSEPAPVRLAQMRGGGMGGGMGGGLIEAIFGDHSASGGSIYAPGYASPGGPSYAVDPRAQGHAYAPSDYAERRSMDPKYEKREVEYDGKQRPGTIVIDSPNHFLYLVEGDGKALRYGIGVGRPGFSWAGVKTISMKREWPDWTPPQEMLRRRPDLPRFMPGGPENPLGARALYLGSSLYRIHGSNEPWTIGTNVSSGCIRMRNEDVIDLYGRVGVGTKVVVL